MLMPSFFMVATALSGHASGLGAGRTGGVPAQPPKTAQQAAVPWGCG
ncbi:hypothetical protein [Archangium sp.]|nr:hypothetical protein [Archangium sp.]